MGIAAIAPVPATVSSDVRWDGDIDCATVVNEAQNF